MAAYSQKDCIIIYMWHIQGNFPTLCGIKYLLTCWLKHRHGLQHLEGLRYDGQKWKNPTQSTTQTSFYLVFSDMVLLVEVQTHGVQHVEA